MDKNWKENFAKYFGWEIESEQTYEIAQLLTSQKEEIEKTIEGKIDRTPTDNIKYKDAIDYRNEGVRAALEAIKSLE